MSFEGVVSSPFFCSVRIKTFLKLQIPLSGAELGEFLQYLKSLK